MVPEPASKTVPNAMKPSSTASGEQSTLQGWTENAAMSSSSSTSLSGRVAPASTEQSSPASSSQIRMSLRTETTLPHVLSSVPTTSSSSVSPSPSQNATDTSDLVVVAAAAPDTPSSTIVRPPPIRMGSGTKIIVPNAFWHDFIGASKNKPTTQYWQRSHPPTPPLASNLLSVGVNDELTTDFDLAADTGVLTVDDPDKGALSNIQAVPHLSRDGGKGGYLNGQKLFIFSDTGVYTTPTKGKDGTFLNFVSSSVAIDVGMNPLKKQSPTLEDGIGEWADSAGRMRGFAPLTQGEHSYNLAMQGQGQRYCIWPESSIIPLNHTHALLYAPIVYDNVNRATGRTSFTYTGLTLLTVTTHIIGGPSANRFVDKLFYHNEVEWGSIAGMRSWGPSGIGGNDGRIYVFGKVEWGLLVGRVDASRIDNRDSYEYWNGNNWAASMLDTSSKAYFIDGAMMDADIFYSPRHLTFIIVYLTVWADNTFFYRYLDCPSAIYPQGVPGGQQSGDYAENLVKCPWSRERVLYKAAAGPTGQYIYAGGIQQGYFDADDITNGGYKMLLTWTVPTGSSPGSEASEYSLMSTIILF
ncbi:MAG: hypothetical protein M1833_005777 [Piccolia ochrophora]|nr:MAG: hypothetical protein M1833_005777 [Piccolia ochrophora]